MNLIAALCSMSWVLIMISVYLLLLLETFMIADNSGIFLIMMVVPTMIDCIFLCAIMPFFWELLTWFDKSITLEKQGLRLNAEQRNVVHMPVQQIEQRMMESR